MLRDPNCHVVVRSAGERTEQACLALVQAQLKDDSQCTLIRAIPFEEALRETYRVGIRSGAAWTITVDADVLLFSSAIAQLVGLAEGAPPGLCMIQGRVFDRVSGSYRPAGFRCYRSQHLERALALVPQDGVELQPEYSTLCEMAKLGLFSRFAPNPFGLHDYEQYLRDLYRKAFIHAKKHPEWVGAILGRCGQNLDSSDDFPVIARGLWDGALSRKSAAIDVRFQHGSSKAALRELGLLERSPITQEELASFFIPGSLEALLEYPADALPTFDQAYVQTLGQRVARAIRDEGPIRGSVGLIGRALARLGRAIEGRNTQR